MSTQAFHCVTPEEYLAFDDQAEYKSEYYNGEMFAMAGGSLNHNGLTFVLGGMLHAQLAGKGCRGFSSDMRVRVPATNLYAYPDMTIVCGAPKVVDSCLMNPTVIVEVLSPSTEGYDRGRKFDHYQTLDSLKQYVTVAQDRVQLVVHTRTPEGDWLMRWATSREDTVELASIGCHVHVGELYNGIDFTVAGSGPPPVEADAV